MRFHELPFRLRLYILAHLVVLAPLGQLVAHQPLPSNGWLVGALLIATVTFSTWKVELTILQARMTLSFAAVCLAQLLQGFDAALLCASVGACVGTVARPESRGWKVTMYRPPLYRIVFNVANCVLASVAASLVYAAVLSLSGGTGWEAVLGLVAFTTTYFAVNTFGVSLAIAYQQQLPWLSVWQQNFLWTAPGFFASASIAAGVWAGFHRMGMWSLLFAPPLYVIFHSYRLYMDRLHLYSAKVRQDMTHIEQLNELNQAIIASLAMAIDAKDRHTCAHINRVRHYAVALARAAGVSGPEMDAVATGALVHDIGKLGIPDHILGKPGKLTPEEFRRIQSHVTIGTEILSPIPFPFPVVDIVRTHHERWDGLGYPRGLKGEEIPIGGRIVAIVDVFDALTSDRPYRRAMTHEEAVATLEEHAGTQFDPRLVGLFAEILPQLRAEIEQLEDEAPAHSIDAEAPVEGAAALSQISQAAAQMAAVCDVAYALAEQETLEQISSVVVEWALALLPADTVVLYLKEEDDTRLVAAAVDGKYRDKLRGMTIQAGEGVAGSVARNQQPRVNVSAALDVARRFTPEETVELSAATAVPLVHGPENLGVLAVYTLGYRVISEQHLHVLTILAEHAAAAVQNARRCERRQELADTDPLTNLANSRGLVRHLERLTYPRARAERAEDGPFSVVMLDLDRFKEVNDTLGHRRGDELLRCVAGTLTDAARPGDVVCRYAGDEFVLLLPDADREQAERVAARVREAIDALPPVDGQVKIGASAGVASFPEDGMEGRALLHVAACRVYEDKFQRRANAGARDAVCDRVMAAAR